MFPARCADLGFETHGTQNRNGNGRNGKRETGGAVHVEQGGINMWTQFIDMHSGGGLKEKWQYIYIEAPEAEAKIIFYNRFGHNPERVTCTCCGADYSIEENGFLAQLTGFERHCASLETPKDSKGLYQKPDDPWFKEHYYLEPGDEAEAQRHGYKTKTSDSIKQGEHQALAQYMKNKDVLFIHAKDIKPKERKGKVPVQGYVWKD